MKYHNKLNTYHLKKQLTQTHNFLRPYIDRVIDYAPIPKQQQEDLKTSNKYVAKAASKAIDIYDQYMQPSYREENKQNVPRGNKKVTFT